MQLKFDANQDFQLKAIDSIIGLFDGQPLNKGDFEISLKEYTSEFLNEYGVGRNLIINNEWIFNNLNTVRTQNDLEVISRKDFDKNGLNFTLEMETGTGKTYVYLRTIYELNRVYGFKKFVIVVPSIAIKEGVLKNLEITNEHFKSLYNNVPSDFYVYDSRRLSELRNFAISNSIQILVINIDSFAKDINIINRPNDKLTGKEPIEFIKGVKPIVILDEPQNMGTEKRKNAILNLNPLFILRYSATHKYLYNLIYRLDPVRAYNLGLVKQIEVDSVYEENNFNQAYIGLEQIKPMKTKIKLKLKIDVDTDNGIQRKSVNAEYESDLYDLSNKLDMYKNGFIINGIDVSNSFIEFSNGIKVYKGQAKGCSDDEIMKTQIEYTIKTHLEKEKEYNKKGIKVLSLFFIDRVKNYREYNNGKAIKGKFAIWFEEIFSKYSKLDKDTDIISSYQIDKIHNGYFAVDNKGKIKDTKGESKADDDAYQLIMKDKERLLDINNPLRFIFSHSALREGWDNPNVFQICTLNETKSEMKKRQEIGRGLRLPVNQEGIRINDKNINILTVIANESYENFAKRLQKEIEDDCGVNFEGKIKNKKEKNSVKLRNEYELDPKFLELWDKIRYKTTYRVKYDTNRLIEDCSREIKKLENTTKPKIVYEKVKLDINDEGIRTSLKSIKKEEVDSLKIIDFPDIINYIQNKTDLTRNTILTILKKSERINDLLINPQLFLDRVVNIIKTKLEGLIKAYSESSIKLAFR